MENHFFISYMDSCFFGGARYFKIWYNNEKDKYIIDYLKSSVPNIINEDKNKFIEKRPIDKDRYNGLPYKFGKTFTDYLKTNYRKKIVDILNIINLEEIEKETYNSDDLDGTNWQIYVEYKGKILYKEGYVVFPKEIEEIIRLVENIQ